MGEQRTNAQSTASDPASSVWVTANAGTGKTKVLTDRVLRLMLGGVEPDKILCLTFTKAAAAEMAQRIQSQLSEWAIMPEEVLRDSLHALTGSSPSYSLLNKARKLFTIIADHPDKLRIQTIHGFCQSILTRFPLEAGIPPHFSVDETRAQELLRASQAELLASVAQQTHLHQAMTLILETVSYDTLKKTLQEMTAKRDKFMHLLNQHNGIEGLIENIYRTLGLTTDSNAEAIINALTPDNPAEFRHAITAWEKDNKYDRAAILKYWINANTAERLMMINDYKNIFLTQKEEHRALSSVMTKNACTHFPQARTWVNQRQNELTKVLDKLRSLRTAELTEALLHISQASLELYQVYKTHHGLLDYDDLIFYTHHLLNRSEMTQWILYKMDYGIDHILVDEAQDTSPEQWQIIEAIVHEFFSGNSRTTYDIARTLFVVGDKKQSIFSFRGADIETFETIHQLFKQRAEQAGVNWNSVSLDQSFRSTAPVLQAVDSVFNTVTLKEATQGEQSDIIHQIYRSDTPGHVEVWPLVSVTRNIRDNYWSVPVSYESQSTAPKQLANNIAETIDNWLRTLRILPAKGRPVKPNDILILVQQRQNSLMQHLIHALEERQIPTEGMDRITLTEHIAVKDLIALGNFLLLPQDDLILATILKSPLIGMNENMLFELAHDRKTISLWERLQQLSDQNPIYSNTLNYLNNLLNKKNYLLPLPLYSLIIDGLNARQNFIARMGQEVNDPLNEFLNYASLYSRSYTPSLQGFLHWLEQGGAEIKRDFEQESQGVRVMTVHGAKGLQAPIVFLADTTHVPQNARKNILCTDDACFWPGKAENQNIFYSQYKGLENQRIDNERFRLLYVAMTRAEDELYITGCKKTKFPEKQWYTWIESALSNCSITMPDGKLVLSTLPITATGKPSAISTNIALPEFAQTDAIQENTLSTFDDNEINNNVLVTSTQKFAIERGIIIHRLLEFLPEVTKEKRESVIRNIITKYLPDENGNNIIQKINNILYHNDFKYIFCKNSVAEVMISATSGNDIISRQIDRLVITENEVIIIDYKTHHTPPTLSAVPAHYLKQMATYRMLLQQLYPDKPVRCALLWTSTLTLMPLDDNLLNEYSTLDLIAA